MRIQDLYEGFNGGLKEFQTRGEGLIPAGVDIDKNMRLRISLRRESTTEVLNRGLCTSAIEANKIWRKRDRGRWGGEGLIMVETYTHVENS